jgi:hypothetical protein
MAHIEQVQVPTALVGSLSPAADQSKATGVALTGAGARMSAGIVGDIGAGAGVGAAAAASGLGASHTQHLLSVSFVLQLHAAQVHSPATGILGFNPAAAQSKATGVALTGVGAGMSAGIVGDIGAGAGVGAAAAASGLGASHTQHLLSVSFVLQLHAVQVHSPATGVLGFNPAAAQLKAVGLACAWAAGGAGESLGAGAGVARVEVVAGSRPAAAQLRVVTACLTGAIACVEAEAARTGGTVFFLSIQRAGSNIGLRSISNAGSSSWDTVRAIVCASGSPITTS